jgi:DNA modification methylase
MPNHPNQLPERYLERVIKAYTIVGDWVFDPFGGTGTTATVAAKLGRNAYTTELSQQYYNDIVIRLLNIGG